MQSNVRKLIIITSVLIWTALIESACTAGDSNDAEPKSWLSEQGTYTVSFESDIDPIPVNQMHSWVLHVATDDEQAVVGAELAIAGGMPAHNHGLPTVPRVTQELGDGNYRVEGIRFHMKGAWEITVTIKKADKIDVVTIASQL